jgi:virulence factor Mce-like protein
VLADLLGITPGDGDRRSRGVMWVGAAVLAGMVAVGGLAVRAQLGAGDNSYHLSAHFDTVNGIIEGSEVMIGGVVVGSVTGETVDPDSHGVVVDMSIDPRYAPVHQGATAAVRPKSLLGEKYIDLGEGDTGQPTLPSGTMLPRDQTSVNVEIDQLINTFDEPTRQQLRSLIDELGTGLAGQGKLTNQTFQSGRMDLDSLASVTDVLKQRDSELKTVIQSLTRLTETMASDQQRQNYPQLLQHSDEVLTTLRSEDAYVQQGIDRMDTFFTEIDNGLAGQGGNLDDILRRVPATVTDLNTLSNDLYAKGQVAYPLVKDYVVPSVIGGPVVFGSQTAGTSFTRNVYTRVQTPVGCAPYDSLNPDGSDSGQVAGDVCSVPASNCVANPPAPGACAATLQAQICAMARQTPFGALCPAGPAGANVPSLPGGTPTQPTPAPPPASQPPGVDTTTRQQTEDLLLRYLLQ